MNSEQLNIGFVNDSSYGRFWNNLSKKLEPVTNGIPLQEWIEYIGNNLYSQSRQTLQLVDLEKYYPLTKVSKCVYNQELLLNARLISNPTDFIIELKDYGERNDMRRQRYFIAHEIAHTFFFNTKSNPIRDYKFFPYGSKEIEFLCNRMARAILMPNMVLDNKIHKLPSIHDDSFSLESIKKLCNSFRVPYNVLLNRIISDTSLWNCLFMRFRLYESEDNKWKLRERYVPSGHWQNNKAYIPQEDLNKSKDNPNRFPSAKGTLAKAFEDVYVELLDCQRITKEYIAENISDSPLKSFFQFYFADLEKVKVHYSLGRDKYSKSIYLNVCIPLPIQNNH